MSLRESKRGRLEPSFWAMILIWNVVRSSTYYLPGSLYTLIPTTFLSEGALHRGGNGGTDMG
jgi:hypothetical protein